MSYRYYQHERERSLSEYDPGKTVIHKHVELLSDEDLNDAKKSKTIQSTLKLKLNLLLVSLFSIALVSLAALQSYKQFVTLGYAPLVQDNSHTAIINAVVAVYGAITGMATRIAVTQCLNLISIKALTTGGKFIWSAKTWAYMSHANGPWYTLGPLFLAGLAATAVISILPAAVVDSGHHVYLQVAPDSLTQKLSCISGSDIQPNIWCTGASIAAMLLQSYSTIGRGYASYAELMLSGQVSSNRSLGYPWNLVNNNLAEYVKYNISGGSHRQSNKTACVWVLDQTPMKCSFLNYTTNGEEFEVQSPYTDNVYFFANTSSLTQAAQTQSFDNGLTEMAVIGWFDTTINNYNGASDAFVCISKELSEVHVGRYITSGSSASTTYVDLANDTSCQPTYSLPSPDSVFTMVNDMAGGVYQFASVDGWNTLIESFSNGYFDIGVQIFGDSESMLEDGMGAFMALLLSHFYATSNEDSPNTPNATRVNGGYMVTTVGLGRNSRLYIWLIVAILPLFALSVAVCITLDYIPTWDVMNPMDALATEAIIDEKVAATKGRSSGIRLGIFNGRVVASNTNLPTRISKEDKFWLGSTS